MCLFGSVIE